MIKFNKYVIVSILFILASFIYTTQSLSIESKYIVGNGFNKDQYLSAYVYYGNSNHSIIVSRDDGSFYLISMDKPHSTEGNKMNLTRNSFTQGSGYFDVIGGHFYLCHNKEDSVTITQYNIQNFEFMKNLTIPNTNINFSDRSIHVNGGIVTVILSQEIIQFESSTMEIFKTLSMKSICRQSHTATTINDSLYIGCTSRFDIPLFIRLNLTTLDFIQTMSYNLGFFPTCLVSVNDDSAVLVAISPFDVSVDPIVLLLLDKDTLAEINRLEVPLKNVYPRITLADHGNGAIYAFGHELYLVKIKKSGVNLHINFEKDSSVSLQGYVTSGIYDHLRKRSLILTSESLLYSIRETTGALNPHDKKLRTNWWIIMFFGIGLVVGLVILLVLYFRYRKQNENGYQYQL